MRNRPLSGEAAGVGTYNLDMKRSLSPTFVGLRWDDSIWPPTVVQPSGNYHIVNPYVLSFSLQRYEIMWTSDDFFNAIIIAEGILGQRPLNKESADFLRGCLSTLLLRDSFL